jgi:hypothetical protein
VLAEARRRQARSTVVAGNAELMSLVRHFTHFRVVQRPKEPSVAQLRVVDQIARPLDHTCRHAGGLQAVHQRTRVVLRREFGELAVDEIALRPSPRKGFERGCRRPLRVAERVA